VQFVWHSWAAPRLASLEDFYPGDHVIDWMGILLFQQWYPWSVKSGSPSDVQHVLELAQQHGKPVMIAESTPFGGIKLALVSRE
jgi:beta-mannanase